MGDKSNDAAQATAIPDSRDGKLVSTLRAQPKYTVKLRMGSIEDLFEDAPESPRGRMARMQVLGLFYVPLKHKTVIEGAKLPDDRKKTDDPYTVCWTWVKERIFGEKDDKKAQEILVDALKFRVVGGAEPVSFRTPPDKAGGGLPPAATDPDNPTPENFRKIRVPGGYSFTKQGNDYWVPNHDPAYPFDLFSDQLYDAESRYYEDNPALGKIPIVATVTDSNGKPVPNARVTFRLVPPHEKRVEPFWPAVSKVSPVISNEEKLSQRKGDPQSGNCPKDRGGKLGGPLTSDGADARKGIFSTTPPRGFDPVEESGPHAVKTVTNVAGEAGVIFMPSRMAGDRYRLRAAIASPTAADETGTLVVWRNLRVSRYLLHDVAAASEILVKDAASPPYNAGKNYNAKKFPHLRDPAKEYMLKAGLIDENDAAGTRGYLTPISLEAAKERFAQAFCEIEFDGNPDTQWPTPIAKDEWEGARERARKDVEEGMARWSKKYDMGALFCTNEPAITIDKAVAHLPMRTPQAYNRLLGNAKDPRAMAIDKKGQTLGNDIAHIKAYAQGYAWPGFMRYLSRNGFLPGITLIQGAAGCTWQLFDWCDYPGAATLPQRGCCFWHGEFTWNVAPRTISETLCHEMGHWLFRRHAPGLPGAKKEAKGEYPPGHDDPKIWLCLMSYDDRGNNLFCGKCLLALRGWDIREVDGRGGGSP